MKENLDIFESFVREKETAYLDGLEEKLKKIKANSTGLPEYTKSIASLEKKIAEEKKRLGYKIT